MTGIDRLLAAMAANKHPSPAAYRAALAELDDGIADLMSSVRASFETRARIEAHRQVSEILRSLHKGVEASERASADAAGSSEPDAGGHELCDVCDDAEARIWDNGRAYCKRCARETGVVVRGKIV